MERFKFIQGIYTDDYVIPPIYGAVAAAYSDGTPIDFNTINSKEFQDTAVKKASDKKIKVNVITAEQITPQVTTQGDNLTINKIEVDTTRSGEKLSNPARSYFENIKIYKNISVAPAGKINWNYEESNDTKVHTNMILNVNGVTALKQAIYNTKAQLNKTTYKPYNTGDTGDTTTHLKIKGRLRDIEKIQIDTDAYYKNGKKYIKTEKVEGVDTKYIKISALAALPELPDEVSYIVPDEYSGVPLLTGATGYNDESASIPGTYFVQIDNGAVPTSSSTFNSPISLFKDHSIGKPHIIYIFNLQNGVYVLYKTMFYQKDKNTFYKNIHIPENKFYVIGNNTPVVATLDNTNDKTVYAKKFDTVYNNEAYSLDEASKDLEFCVVGSSAEELANSSNSRIDDNGNIIPIDTEYEVYDVVDKSLTKTCLFI